MKYLVPAAILSVVLAGPPAAMAGVLDSPLPTLGGAKTALNYVVTGVVNAGGLGTMFSCTNTSSTPIAVTVEVFADDGAAPCNSGAADAVTLAPGVTVMFSTQNTSDSSFQATQALSSPYLAVGSARIVSNAKALACSAFIADVYNSPPTSMVPLNVVARGKQRGD
jgi:hypothetical protein